MDAGFAGTGVFGARLHSDGVAGETIRATLAAMGISWHERKGNRWWSSSGITPVGTKAPTCVAGYGLTTGQQRQRANGAGSPTCGQSKVPGSIRLNPAGFMPNAVFVNRMAN